MPAVRGDGMRGLAVFISDIRNCEYLKHSRLILMLLFFKLYWLINCNEILPFFVTAVVCEKQGFCYMFVIPDRHCVVVVLLLVFVLLPIQILIRRLAVVIEDFMIFVSKTMPGWCLKIGCGCLPNYRM
jgi:hypothetical protein